MTLQDAFGDFWRSAHTLRESLTLLRLTVCEDAPHRGRTMVVDELCAAAIDSSGRIEEVLEAITRVRPAGEEVPDPTAVAAALSACTGPLDAASVTLHDASRFDRLVDVERLAGSGGAWTAWAASTTNGLEEAGFALRRLERAHRACWRELAERNFSISVKATGIEHLELSGADALDAPFAGAGIPTRRTSGGRA